MTEVSGQKEVAGARVFVRTASQPSGSCAKDSAANDPRDARAGSSGGCPVVGSQASASAECPVITKDFDPRNLMPSSSNQPTTGQSKPLGTERVPSSIPIAADDLPAHQQAETPVWIYPSEQMFYNAMRRKGWQPSEDDMHTVVQIHNGVNERAWSEVLRWEGMHSAQCGAPKLKRFLGRPQEYSPKARLLNFFGYKLPFDRHDWYVDRCGSEIRYVIDFYNAAPLPGMPVAMHLDVRPALDSPFALWDRLKMQARWVKSGRWKSE